MALPGTGDLPTHAVENQPESGWQGDLWAEDAALRESVMAFGADGDHLAGHAGALSNGAMRAKGPTINHAVPELKLFDRAGRRLDEVAFHPAYHEFLSMGLGGGYAAMPWSAAPGGHATHAAMVYLHSQVEPGTCCPMTMSYAGVPVLRASDGDIGADWAAKLTIAGYDPAIAPLARKSTATLGMAMTEKQGGSDLRTNTTCAEPADGHYRLTGHKWFCSAPMSDGFLTLAVAPRGLSCFLVPRWLEEGRNAIHLMRLKDKLGNRSNASAEIEYHGARAFLIGEEGRGVRTIIEMVHHTRLDTAMAPAGLMRAALAEALHWCRNRTAFQRKLIDQPLMGAVLADLAIDTEAALWLGMRVAHAFDGTSDEDRAFARLAVALAKFLNNKRCPNVIYEAMEVMGGMGYVDDTPLPMLYREAPLNSIWEGSGNVICLDILRTLDREPAASAALQAELDLAAGQSRAYDAALAAARSRWPGLPEEARARSFAERMAVLLTASILIRHAPSEIADGFIASRVEGDRQAVTGTAAGIDAAAVLKRFAD